ncbi:hypothetical protein R9X47_28875 [Wukongibacter baidiensis]|uniref:hypothetical protein n=1 Tax=Wukongibacter baidiensis TaxID=1723361 RepID=UPI003D7F5806
MTLNHKSKHSIKKYNKDILKLNEEEQQLMKRLNEINKERAKKQIYIAEIYLNRVKES